jgi:hypothetical protein
LPPLQGEQFLQSYGDEWQFTDPALPEWSGEAEEEEQKEGEGDEGEDEDVVELEPDA